ncbi:mediator of DNA damage checkpoint protein 1-like isoform X3 [Astyanax mexicanus]|uniref:mediator of DNA damage checkpoint protein 1-like isoform X3 n=1 Tax=Astyanax mexicanus TaxID=7994 RepID=UPI0020CAAF77|nr:mediator of DNA damage checkpoint protein 1-like isoform X3 [Astyanax mexicanus]
MAKRLIRRKQLSPQQDAEIHIKNKTDKLGLEERFISSSKGRGVFATANFSKGDFILEYRGQLLTQNLIQNINSGTVFIFDFQWRGKYWSVDASVEDKSLGRLVNDEHKKPNCKIKVVEVDGMPTLCLFALRDILPGEEINYNYGDSDWPWRKQVKPEASTAKTLQKPLITTGEENYPVKCAKRALTASRVQEKREAPRKSFTIMESEEQGEHSVSCIQKSPETDCSSCPVIDEDSSQDKPLGAAENQEQGEHSVSCIQKSPETDCSSCPVIDEDSSQDKPLGAAENQEQGEHTVSCIQKSPETDCSSCPVIDEDSSQDKPLGAAENQMYAETPMSHIVRDKQTVSSRQTKGRTRSLERPLGITERKEQGEHSVSCIQKSPETDCSSCPVIDEDSSQDKPLGAAENQEQGEHSVSCIQKSPETDCSSCPVIDEDSSQDKPLGAAENQCGTAEHVPRTDMKQSALEKHREMLLLQRAELSCEISKIDKLLDSPSPGADSRGSNSLLGTEDLEMQQESQNVSGRPLRYVQ